MARFYAWVVHRWSENESAHSLSLSCALAHSLARSHALTNTRQHWHTCHDVLCVVKSNEQCSLFWFQSLYGFITFARFHLTIVKCSLRDQSVLWRWVSLSVLTIGFRTYFRSVLGFTLASFRSFTSILARLNVFFEYRRHISKDVVKPQERNQMFVFIIFDFVLIVYAMEFWVVRNSFWNHRSRALSEP